MKPKKFHLFPAVAMSVGVTIASLSQTVNAANYTWDITSGDGATITAGNGTWDTTTANWNTGAANAVWANGNTAIFGGADGTYAVTVGASASALQLFANNSGYTLGAASAQTVTLTKDSGSFGSALSADANHALVIATGKTFTVGNNVTLLANGSTTGFSTTAVLKGTGSIFNINSGSTFSRTNGAAGVLRFAGIGTVNVAGTASFASAGTGGLMLSSYSTDNITVNVNNGGVLSSAGTGANQANYGAIVINNGAGTTTGGTGILNINAGGSVTASYATATNGGVIISRNANGVGTLNLGDGTVGSGTLTTPRMVSLAGTGTLNFNGGTLKPNMTNNAVDGSAFLANLTAANVKAGGAIIDTNGFNVTVGQALQHDSGLGATPDGGLTKNGTGTLTLSGANAYTGPTTINKGILALTSTGTIPTAITANSGGALGGTGTITPAVTMNAGSSIVADGTANVLTFNGGLNFAGATKLRLPTTAVAATTYPLFKYGAGGKTGYPANVQSPLRGTLVDNGVDTVSLDFTGYGLIVWGTTNGTWATGTGTWTGDFTQYYDGDTVIFGNPASPSTVTLNDELFPASVTFNNTNAYTFSGTGAISGSPALIKSGTGSVTLSTGSTHTLGAVTLNDGTLGGNVTLSGTSFAVAKGTAGVVLAGSGALTKTTAETVTLSGNNTYTGATTINEGALTVTGAINAGNSTAAGSVVVGNLASTTGTLNQSSGTINAYGDLPVGAVASATGVVNLNGGTFNSQNDFVISRDGNGSVVVNGGTLNVATTTTRWLIVNRPTAAGTASGQMDVNSGNVNLNANTALRFSTNTNAGGTNVVNLNGGAITTYSDNATTPLGSGVVDLMQAGNATSNNTFNLNGGALTIRQVVSTTNNGTRAFNFNGGTLKANGVTTSFVSLGTGTVRANIRNGGAIIDTNSFNVTIPQALLHSNVGGDNTKDGGLTKNGLGTLTLSSAANAYTGDTNVNAGQITLADNAQLKFVLGSSGVNNKITGSGTVQLDGDFTLDTTGAAAASGNSWQIVDVGTLTETYGATFTVVGANQISPGVWIAGQYRFTQSTGLVEFVEDTDGDGLPDVWEITYFGNITSQNGTGDADSDGATNAQEFAAGSNPSNSASTPTDTDADGLTDAWEVTHFGNIGVTNDGTGDIDGDGSTNAQESTGNTDPYLSSSYPGSTVVYLTADNALGTTGVNAATGWSDALAPSAGKVYATRDFMLRTPPDGNSYTFAGDSLIIDAKGNDFLAGTVDLNDALMWKGTGTTATLTINDLQVNGGYIRHANGTGDTFRLAGNLTIGKLGAGIAVQGPMFIDSAIHGAGPLYIQPNGVLTLASASNDYTGTITLMNSTDARLTLADTGKLKFVIGAAGVNNKITCSGTLGTLVLNGTFEIDTTGASLVDGNSWTLVEVTKLAETFSSSFAITGYSDVDSDGIWYSADGQWRFSETTGALSYVVDTDLDELPDSWETTYFGNLAQTPTDDPDGDGATNSYELLTGSNPNNGTSFADTDSDGLADGWEIANFGNLTTATATDHDGDGLADLWEDANFGDNDGIVEEADLTPQDGFGDPDEDGATNEYEETTGSNPNNAASFADTDSDGLADGWEISTFGNLTTATATDHDGDGLADLWEDANFGNNNSIVEESDLTPQDGFSDPDGDNADNETEETAGSNPNNITSTPSDVDADGLADVWETTNFGNTTAQTGTGNPDGDAHNNEAEETGGSNPNDPLSVPGDINGDGIADGHRLLTGDVVGTSSFSSGLNWDDVLAPVAGSNYMVAVDGLRTVDDALDQTFAGDKLVLYTASGRLIVKGTGIITVNDLVLDGGAVVNATNANAVFTLAGAINVAAPSQLQCNNNGINVTATLSGAEELTITGTNVKVATFNATNTFTGNLNLSTAGMALGSTGTLKFVPGATGENNAITGSGAASLNGTFNIDLTGASSAPGANWDLITTSGAVTIGANFTVSGFTADAGAFGVRKWTSGSYEFDEATGILSVATGGNDTDADGMDDTWENTYFSGLAQSATGDFDGDDTDNLTEFRLGLIPNSGSSRFVVNRSAAGLLSWPSVEGVTFSVQRSTTLAAGSWTNIASVPGTAGTASYTDPAPPVGKAFYRILLEP